MKLRIPSEPGYRNPGNQLEPGSRRPPEGSLLVVGPSLCLCVVSVVRSRRPVAPSPRDPLIPCVVIIKISRGSWPVMIRPVGFIVVLVLASSAWAMLLTSPFHSYRSGVVIRSSLLRAEVDKRGDATPPTSTPGLKAFECTSCAYVYNEETGYKKRAPPGTKWETLATFACPVCGAAKDKFREISPP